MVKRGPYNVPATRSGEWLKLARLNLRMTQDEMGAKLGVSGVEISRKEAGYRRLTDEQIAIVEQMISKMGEK